MRVLHTSDWHVGRAVRGRSREDEHRAVFDEIAGIIRDEHVDLVLIAGDVFDHQAPSAAAEEIVYEALLKFTANGTQVVMISGNHDHPDRIEAVSPLLRLANIHAAAKLRRPEDGGCIDVTVRTGETARVALMPWPRRAAIVTADDLMNGEQAEHQKVYAERCGRVLRKLAESFSKETVNLVLAHLVITGAMVGGGERMSETAEDYWVPATSLNLNAQYVALGHIHKSQSLNLMWPTWYCGSPLQLDFGEEDDVKGVLVFDAVPGNQPVREPKLHRLRSGRKMMTAHGTLLQLAKRVEENEFGNAYLRVLVQEAARVGLAEEVRELLPNAVEVRIESDVLPMDPELSHRAGMQPRELLGRYFEQANVQSDDVMKLFDELIEEEYAAS